MLWHVAGDAGAAAELLPYVSGGAGAAAVLWHVGCSVVGAGDDATGGNSAVAFDGGWLYCCDSSVVLVMLVVPQ
jgi:hypothetical protein